MTTKCQTISNDVQRKTPEMEQKVVRKMRDDDERIARFLAAVKTGEQQLKNGKIIPFCDELMDKIEKDAVGGAARSKPINNSDILP